jgi:hypothetical protein
MRLRVAYEAALETEEMLQANQTGMFTKHKVEFNC